MKTHIICAVPMAMLVVWAFISADRPKLATQIEVVAIVCVAVVLLLGMLLPQTF
ncbi:hypothetical protein [Blastopirellula marina]|nr:hypothetical protein [Blastopirellula marina]